MTDDKIVPINSKRSKNTDIVDELESKGLVVNDMDDRPRLNAGDVELDKISSQGWDMLREADAGARIFRVGGAPSRIESADVGGREVKLLTTVRLRQELARAASWYRINSKFEEIPAKAPRDVAETMLAQGDIDLPVLERIVEAPVFASDGTIATEPGYHPASRTYYANGGLNLRPVSDEPPAAEAEQALAWINELFRDFPFASNADKATAIAAMLGPFVRDLVDGSTPLHAFEAPTPGTGKGLISDVVAIPATGSRAATITEARNEDEWRKRITAMLRNGRAITLIDNVGARLDSPALSAALTSPLWTDRLLGQSEIVAYPVRTTWLVTGNNISMSREIARRTVRCRMDAGVEHPEDRKGFTHELPTWAYKHRSQLVWSILTIVRRWLAGGGKPWSGTALGSIESWCRSLGGILESVGIDDFLGNLEDFRAESDEESLRWRAFVSEWWDKYGEQEVSGNDLFAFAQNHLDLGSGTLRSQQTRVGTLLVSQRDRLYGGRVIRRKNVIRGHRMWQLELKEKKS